MILAFIAILLVINVIGMLNRQKVWSKVLLVSQVFFIGGMFVIFNVYDNDRGIEANQKKENGINDYKEKSEKLTKIAKDKLDSSEIERNNQDSKKVKGF